MRLSNLLAIVSFAAVFIALAVVAVLVAGREPNAGLGKVAYIVDGNLYVKELPDGEPQQLTDERLSGVPQWADNGKWLSVAQEGNGLSWLVMRPDGSETHQTLSLPTSSPTGNLFVGLDWETSDVVVEAADGTGRTTLAIRRPPGTVGLSDNLGLPRWMPVSGRVSYTRSRVLIPEGFEGGCNCPQRITLRTVLPDGTDDTMIAERVTEEGENYTDFGWSEDEQYYFSAANTSPPSTGTALPEGLEILQVATGEVVDSGVKVHNLYDLHQQPGGRDILIVETAERGSWRGKRIGRMNPTTGGVTYLTPPEVAAIEPKWSPDGRQILYAAVPADPSAEPGSEEAEVAFSQRHLWLMNSDGSNQRQLTSDPRYRDEAAEWSADGTHLLFVRIDLQSEEPGASIWLLDLASGDLTEVVDRIARRPDQANPNGYDLRQFDDPVWEQRFDYYPGP